MLVAIQSIQLSLLSSFIVISTSSFRSFLSLRCNPDSFNITVLSPKEKRPHRPAARKKCFQRSRCIHQC